MPTNPIAEDVYCPKHGVLCYEGPSGILCPLCGPVAPSADVLQESTQQVGLPIDAYCEGTADYQTLIDAAAGSGRRWGSGRVVGDGLVDVSFGVLDSGILIVEEKSGSPWFFVFVKNGAPWTRDLRSVFGLVEDTGAVDVASAQVRTIRPAVGRRVSVSRVELDHRGEVQLLQVPSVGPSAPDGSRSGPVANASVESVREEPQPRTSNKRAVVSVGIVGAVALALLWYPSYSSVANRVDRALAANNIFGPGGALAIYYDAASAGSTGLTAARQALRPKLEAFGEESFNRWYRDSATINWEQMSQVYDVLSQTDPTNVEFAARKRYSDAQGLFDRGRFEDAYRLYEEAIKFKPNWVLALNGQAKVLIRDDSPMKDFERGVRTFEAAILADPQFVWAYKNLGEHYKRDSRRLSDAVRYLSMASKLSPDRTSIIASLRDAERRQAAEAAREQRRRR